MGRQGTTLAIALALASGVMFSCADTFKKNEDDSGAGGPCTGNETRCQGDDWQTCVDSKWTSESCSGVCVEGLGCRTCSPGTKYCKEQESYECNAEGTQETKLATCAADQQCILGECSDACDLPQKGRSNVGCEFWAVDLPNEYACQTIDGGVSCFLYNCAACEQFAVVVANTSGFNVRVQVEINEAQPGQPLQLALVEKKELKAGSLGVFFLPMREVDCTEWRTDGQKRMRRTNDSQTCLTSRAYRVTSSYPVVAYQFNPIINQSSNGASMLIPTNGLDTQYYVLGWSTSNPFTIPIPGGFSEGMPDYTNVTLVGVSEDTEVEIKLAHQTQGSKDGKIPAAKAGETLKVKLGPFDVLNVNTIQDFEHPTGDLTGSFVSSSKPLVVFSGAQRASVGGPRDFSPAPPQPSDWDGKICCTEHFEQQMFPVSSLGTTFAITRTPVRSTTAIIEPDYYRILATEDGTQVKTNETNYPTFALNAGQSADFWSTGDFTVEASKPIMIAQYAVAQGFLDSWDSVAGGDPEFVVFPPVEQYRQEYVFLAPPSFDKDYVVVGAPESAAVKLDNQDINGEFKTLCSRANIGVINNENHVAMTCPIADGVHRIDSSKPVGIMVYGYYSVGSYGYPGGADVKKINIR